MGFIQETNDDDGIYDIYVLDLSTNLWGQTQYESGGSTFIKIRNSYQGMSNFCEDSNQLLWLTVAHEFSMQFNIATNLTLMILILENLALCGLKIYLYQIVLFS